jgi:hypothetical protein
MRDESAEGLGVPGLPPNYDPFNVPPLGDRLLVSYAGGSAGTHGSGSAHHSPDPTGCEPAADASRAAAQSNVADTSAAPAQTQPNTWYSPW